ncbi:hypothetical protein J1N35_011376, partial [Gossypium stocksii]
DLCTTDNHSELNLERQQEFGSKDRNELNIVMEIFNPINIEVDVVVTLEVDELKLILNENVDESIHYLAITKKVPAKEIYEFNSFSFDE